LATLVFQYGDIENTNSFRERLELKLNLSAQELEYGYFWGMPGKDFGERSRSKMKRIA
jgi:hypothetical protein